MPLLEEVSHMFNCDGRTFRRIRKTVRYKPGTVSKDNELRPAFMRRLTKKTADQIVGRLAACDCSTVLTGLNRRFGNKLNIFILLANRILLQPKLAVQISRVGAERIDVNISHNKRV